MAKQTKDKKVVKDKLSIVDKKSTNYGATFIALNEFVADPDFIVDQNHEYVLYGEDNELPYQLIEYYRNVGIHRSIIDKKKKMFLGKGLAINYTDDKTAKKTLQFLKNINQFENANQLFDKAATDLMLFGGVYFQVIWEKGGKKIKEVYHMAYEQMRSAKKDKYGQVQSYYYNTSEDKQYKWKKYTTTKDKWITELPVFNVTSNKTKPQILYIHEYEPGNNYYSLPDYIGALRDLNTMGAISDFHNANIHNNMQPGLSIFFNGPEPSNEAKDAIVKEIKKKYANTENAGRPMIFFLEADQQMKMEQPEASDIADMYKLLSEDIKENIIVAHQIPRAVAGLINSSSLGSTKEVLEGVEIVRSNYIEPLQEAFLVQFNRIMEINGLNDIELAAPSPNLMKYNISELKDILTLDEIRKYLGYDALKEIESIEDIEEEIQNENNTNNE